MVTQHVLRAVLIFVATGVCSFVASLFMVSFPKRAFDPAKRNELFLKFRSFERDSSLFAIAFIGALYPLMLWLIRSLAGALRTTNDSEIGVSLASGWHYSAAGMLAFLVGAAASSFAYEFWQKARGIDLHEYHIFLDQYYGMHSGVMTFLLLGFLTLLTVPACAVIVIAGATLTNTELLIYQFPALTDTHFSLAEIVSIEKRGGVDTVLFKNGETWRVDPFEFDSEHARLILDHLQQRLAK